MKTAIVVAAGNTSNDEEQFLTKSVIAMIVFSDKFNHKHRIYE